MEVNNKITIFWHICAINNWVEIVDDQFLTLQRSGLLNDCEEILVTFLGNRKYADCLLKKNEKIRLKNFHEDIKKYERICINDIGEWSKINDSLVFYFHTKGVSKPEFKENIWKWRKMMEYFLIDGYKSCLEHLQNNDVVGLSLCNVGTEASIFGESHKWHFSGNFWWSKTEYIKKLLPVPDIDMSSGGNYWLCERWILQPWPEVKILEIYKPRFPHYYTIEPEEYRRIF